MTIIAPDWLTNHGGALRLAPDGSAWVVLIDSRPEYMITPVPADGKHACEVMQTNNGRRLDGGTIYGTTDDAVRGGLEDLRVALGW
jgi:hypothetical protein